MSASVEARSGALQFGLQLGTAYFSSAISSVRPTRTTALRSRVYLWPQERPKGQLSKSTITQRFSNAGCYEGEYRAFGTSCFEN